MHEQFCALDTDIRAANLQVAEWKMYYTICRLHSENSMLAFEFWGMLFYLIPVLMALGDLRLESHYLYLEI